MNIVITDDDWYEYIKLFSAFFVLAGYSGLIVLVDELVNIYKIPNAITRQYNYEKILTMYNDTLQGKASHLGIIMSSTPQCLEDTRRGIYSYEALRSRLAPGKFSQNMTDLLSPVIRLSPLSNEEMLVLAEKLTEIHGVLYDYTPRVTTEDAASFIRAEFSRVGASEFITPREVIRDWIEALNVMYQNPDADFIKLLSDGGFEFASLEGDHDGGEFAEIEL